MKEKGIFNCDFKFFKKYLIFFFLIFIKLIFYLKFIKFWSGLLILIIFISQFTIRKIKDGSYALFWLKMNV